MRQIRIGGQPVYKVISSKNGTGAYWRLLDLAKAGKIPISFPFYNTNRKTIEEDAGAYLPVALNLHGSYAPKGITFAEANRQHGLRYDGYHVSEDLKTGEKILFPLAEKLPDARGKEVTVADAKDSIILVELNIVNGKPTIKYERNVKKNETLLHLDTTGITCVAFPLHDGWYELKNGIFVKSDGSNPNAIHLRRADSSNWNGFFAMGIPFRPEVLIVHYPPSQSLGVLTKKP